MLFIQYIETSVNELYRMDSHQEININNSSPNKVVLYAKKTLKNRAAGPSFGFRCVRIVYRHGTLLLSPSAAHAVAPRSYPTRSAELIYYVYNSRTTEQ